MDAATGRLIADLQGRLLQNELALANVESIQKESESWVPVERAYRNSALRTEVGAFLEKSKALYDEIKASRASLPESFGADNYLISLQQNIDSVSRSFSLAIETSQSEYIDEAVNASHVRELLAMSRESVDASERWYNECQAVSEYDSTLGMLANTVDVLDLSIRKLDLAAMYEGCIVRYCIRLDLYTTFLEGMRRDVVCTAGISAAELDLLIVDVKREYVEHEERLLNLITQKATYLDARTSARALTTMLLSEPELIAACHAYVAARELHDHGEPTPQDQDELDAVIARFLSVISDVKERYMHRNLVFLLLQKETNRLEIEAEKFAKEGARQCISVVS